MYARKKEQNPSRSWLERVPLKAKMLEAQLYKNASSLEAYLNRSTLKIRLGKLASAITTHYKQATHSKRGSSRSSSSSISSLASLENAFTDARLRRDSAASINSLPTSNNNPINLGKSNDQSSAMPFAPNLRRQSDSILETAHAGKKSPSVPIQSVSNTNNMSNNNNVHNSLLLQNSNDANFDTINSGMTSQQQQFISNLRQQQQELARRFSGGNSNSFPMNASSISNPAMGMMNNGNFSMLNQQQSLLQQQQNAMNMNMNMSLMQQQNLLMQQQQQQQQQPMGPGALSLHNISIMQQQQQRQMQQHQNSNSFMGFPGNRNSIGSMNMMNSNLPPVIPGVGTNIQMNMSNTSMMSSGNMNSNNSNLMDALNMPPPGMADSTTLTPQQRRATTGNIGNDEPASPLSPGSFNW